ncbi:hypothetical protein K9U39_05990 [Rhodoblastus acidophilus]|nr:hypothetical protein [Candidatus Rhodoblastus alkanivorans]MDI4640503.1 hypothetical protein [Rhodoblastus acidophilus]
MAALLLFGLTLFSPAVLNDGDTFWHITAGQWILAHRSAPSVDPFSFTFAGAPWTAHEWLSEVLLAGAFAAVRWSGVVILTGAAMAATAYILIRRLIRDLDGLALVSVAVLGLGLQLGSLLVRPHILALPLLTAWVVGLFVARDEERAPSFVLLPLMTLWANMHGSFLFGLALVAPLALEAFLAAPAEKKFSAARQWVFFGLLALGAALLNPRGIETLIFPIRLMGLKSLSGVKEWQPVSFDHVGGLELSLFALLGFTLRRPVHVSLLRVVVLIGLIYLALQHSRHSMLLGLVAPMILARPIAKAIGQPKLAPSRLSRPQIAVFSSLFLICAGIRLAAPIQRENAPMSPVAAIATVPAQLRDKAVFNDYSFGGFMIFLGIKPFIDGRADMYGDAFLDEYDRIVNGDAMALDNALSKYGIVWSIVRPTDPVAKLFDTRPGWIRVYKDDIAVIHARKDGLAPGTHQ